MWCIILFINSFSKTFPAAFIKLTSLNFDTSVEFSLPGFVVVLFLLFSTSSGNTLSLNTGCIVCGLMSGVVYILSGIFLLFAVFPWRFVAL